MDLIWLDFIWFDLILFDWIDLIWFYFIWYHLIWFDVFDLNWLIWFEFINLIGFIYLIWTVHKNRKGRNQWKGTRKDRHKNPNRGIQKKSLFICLICWIRFKLSISQIYFDVFSNCVVWSNQFSLSFGFLYFLFYIFRELNEMTLFKIDEAWKLTQKKRIHNMSQSVELWSLKLE